MSADLGAALFEWAQDQQSLTDLIGTDFFPVAMTTSEREPPYVVWEIEEKFDYAKQDSAPTVNSSLVTFSCVGRSDEESSRIASALNDLLAGFRSGQMGDVSVQGVIGQGSSESYPWEEQKWVKDVRFTFWHAA